MVSGFRHRGIQSEGVGLQTALLPSFIDPRRALLPQMFVLLTLMVLIEFTCLLIYAQGGRSLGELLVRRRQGRLLNRVSAMLMVGVAIWLLFG
jgi:threonine/homoserine/homoserine lactone efflux protein